MVQTVGVLIFTLVVLCKDSLAINDEIKIIIQGKLVNIAKECYKDIPISQDEIAALKNKNLETSNLQCFVACAFKKTGSFDEAGNLNVAGVLEAAKDILTDSADIKSLEDLFSQCSAVNAEPVSDAGKDCDRAKLAFDCLVENGDKYGFEMKF